MSFSGKGILQRFSMAKRIIRILAVLVPAIIIVIFFLKERSPFGGSNSSFAIDQKKAITRIEFTADTHKLFLEKKGETWLVNGSHETRKSSIQFILKILGGLEIKSPVTPELFNNEIVNKNIVPVKVRIFQHRKLLKSFLVYKTNSNSYGNIMKLREGAKPFIVYVPGNEVEIGPAFNVNELFWQPFTVFELLPSEISSVTVENMRDPGSSFMIRNERGNFRLSDLKNDLADWDTSRVIRYISYFTHIQFESWALDISPEEKKTIRSEQPLYRITVRRTNGETSGLILWERWVNKDGSKMIDSDRLWAITGTENELFVMRYVDIDPVLKKRSYFFPE
jgi:hypothetical protein